MCTKLFRSLSVGILVVLLAGTGFAETYRIDTNHSSAAFQVGFTFARVSGEFAKLSGSIMYDADHPEKSSVQATIQTASINTHNEMRDGHLKGPDFFDTGPLRQGNGEKPLQPLRESQGEESLQPLWENQGQESLQPLRKIISSESSSNALAAPSCRKQDGAVTVYANSYRGNPIFHTCRKSVPSAWK